MGKPITYHAVILDQSGSMYGIRKETIDAYNEQIQQMKLNSKDQDIYACLVTFNGDVFEHIWCEKAETLNEAKKEDYETRGATALRDAIGYTVQKLLETTDPKHEDVAYRIDVISDGYNNASKHYSPEALKELIDSVQRMGNWTFTYMGCSEAYVTKVAEETGIPISNMASWSPQNVNMVYKRKMYSDMKYYADRGMEVKCSTNVYSPDKAVCANFDNVEVPFVVDSNNTVNTFFNDAAAGGSTPFGNKIPVKWKD